MILFLVGHGMHKSLEVEHEQQEPHLAPSGNTPIIYLPQICACVCVCETNAVANSLKTMQVKFYF